MQKLVAKWGVKRSLVLLFGLVLVVLLGASAVVVTRTVRQAFTAQSEDRARAAARVIAAGCAPALQGQPGALTVAAEVDEVYAEASTHYIVVIDANRAVIAHRAGGRVKESPEALVARHVERGLEGVAFAEADRISVS
jgi:sensor histidine kinase regulating citrate/malate metabolism